MVQTKKSKSSSSDKEITILDQVVEALSEFICCTDLCSNDEEDQSSPIPPKNIESSSQGTNNSISDAKDKTDFNQQTLMQENSVDQSYLANSKIPCKLNLQSIEQQNNSVAFERLVYKDSDVAVWVDTSRKLHCFVYSKTQALLNGFKKTVSFGNYLLDIDGSLFGEGNYFDKVKF